MRLETDYCKNKTKALNAFNELLFEHDIEERYDGQLENLFEYAEGVLLPYTKVNGSCFTVIRDKKKGWKIIMDV